MSHLNQLSKLSRRYFLLTLLATLVAGYLFDHATDELAQMLFLVTGLTGLAASVLFLVLAWKADQTARDQRRELITQRIETLPPHQWWRPTKTTVAQTIQQIEAQQRRS